MVGDWCASGNNDCSVHALVFNLLICFTCDLFVILANCSHICSLIILSGKCIRSQYLWIVKILKKKATPFPESSTRSSTHPTILLLNFLRKSVTISCQIHSSYSSHAPVYLLSQDCDSVLQHKCHFQSELECPAVFLLVLVMVFIVGKFQLKPYTTCSVSSHIRFTQVHIQLT